MTAKVERLVNLTVALLEARRPMTFAELRRRTGYYDQADHESARRMFERDKDALRSLGVPIEVRDVAFGEDLGYVVDRRSYELADVDLTPEEVTALAVALQVTGTEGAQLALTKLVARAPDPVALDHAPTTRVALDADQVDEVADAVVARQPLRFGYRAASGTRSERTVDPYAVVKRQSAWYLLGRDHDRDALRAFRLDRVVGGVRAVGDAGGFTPPEELDVEAAVSGPDLGTIDVELAVAPAARWSVELRGAVDTGRTHAGLPVLRVGGMDPVRDRAWLLGLGPDVVVLAPQELRDEVTARLRRLTDDRGGERDDRGGGRDRP